MAYTHDDSNQQTCVLDFLFIIIYLHLLSFYILMFSYHFFYVQKPGGIIALLDEAWWV